MNPVGHYPQLARRRMAPQRFDEYYRCYPLIMAPGVERPELNYGSKIFLPSSALDKVSRLHVQWPIMLELVNGDKGKYTHAGVLEFVAEEGRAYIPQWMMQCLHLDVGDMIQVKTTFLELAKLVKLQPQSVSFLEISDPKVVLEKAFRNFATLTKGDVFNFEYNDEIFKMAVLDVKPETSKMGVSLIETDVSVDFAPPVGYVEPEKKAVSKAGGDSGTSTPRSIGGRAGMALPSGGLLHPKGSMAQAINYDAIAPNATAPTVKFHGEGHRLTSKKEGAAAAANNISATSVPAEAGTPVRLHANNGAPMPLRLPPNKLFLGYEIKPFKTMEEKQREASVTLKPHFTGRGQSLRGVVIKGESSSEGYGPEAGTIPHKDGERSKGRRLDGRPI